MKKVIYSEHFVAFVILLAFSLFALVDLLKPGIPLTHDGKDHVARIANFYAALSEGILVPRWAANLNWGYGHPILMFLYPLPSYIASLFHSVGFDLSNSLKLVFATTYIASGVGMYFWLRTFLGKYPAVLGSVLYLFLPYRFIDLYVRGAIGEHVAFVFPPLILLFSSMILRRRKVLGYILTSISMAGLLLSHNAISIMFLPIFFGWFVLQFFIHKRVGLFFGQSLSLLLGFGLSAFFWIPAFLEGKYTLRDIVTGGGEYADRFVSITSLLYGDWNYGITGQFSTQIGIGGLVWGVIGLIFLLNKKKNKKMQISFFWYLVFLGSVFLMIPISKPIYEIVTTLQKFQFPWRFLSVTVFSLSIVSAISVSYFKPSYQKILVLVSLIMIAILAYSQVKAKGYLVQADEFYKDIYQGTTDTGESAPIWSVRFMEKEPKSPVEVIGGKALVGSYNKSTAKRTYEVQASGSATIRENTLYFPNWEVYVNGVIVPLQYQDPNNRGVMTFKVPDGVNKVEVVFKDTKVRIFANLISVLSGIGLIFIATYYYYKKLYAQKK